MTNLDFDIMGSIIGAVAAACAVGVCLLVLAAIVG